MRLKIILPLLLLPPLLGCGLGYAWAEITFKGMAVRWQPAGNPSEPITRMLGIHNAEKLVVETVNGAVYAASFDITRPSEEPLMVRWKPEADRKIVPAPTVRYYGRDYVARRPSFPASQELEMDYIYRVEGKGTIKFALDPQGSLWIWNHNTSGLDGLVYFFGPASGFLIGLLTALMSSLAVWLIRKKSSASLRLRG